MREIEINTALVDQFPALEADDFTKRTGLTAPPDFTTTVWANATVSGVSVVIAEIGTSGEYTLAFTPTTTGSWVVEVAIGPLTRLVRREYDVVPIRTNRQARKLDLEPTLGPAAVTTGSLFDRLANKDVAKGFSQARDSLQAIRDREG